MEKVFPYLSMLCSMLLAVHNSMLCTELFTLVISCALLLKSLGTTEIDNAHSGPPTRNRQKYMISLIFMRTWYVTSRFHFGNKLNQKILTKANVH